MIAEIFTNYEKLLESALHLDDTNSLSYNTVINKLAYNLEIVLDDYEEYGNICWGICTYMESLCGKAPYRMDHLLRLYYRLADRTVLQECQMFDGESILMDTLATRCGDLAYGRRFHYGEWAERCSSHPLPPGGVDSENHSKLIFSQEEVDTDFERVKYTVYFQAKQKNADVIGGTILGRHAALMAGGVCKVDDLGIEKRLANIVDPSDSTRSAFDSIVLLLQIRGMAKSLFKKPGIFPNQLKQKKIRWVAFLKRWLWDENVNIGNDRLVKHHVLVS